VKTVNEIAKITGISKRTIRYYDQVGLLKPTEISESGYRLYDDKALEILQQILFFKELDVCLNDIKPILNNPNFDKNEMLKSHRELLVLKRNRLDNLIALVDKTVKENRTMSFKEFDMSEIEKSIDANIEKIKNSKHKDALKAVEKEYGSFEGMKESVKDSLRKNPQVIIDYCGSLENYNKILKNAPSYDELIEGSGSSYSEFAKNLSDLQDREVADPEVQSLVDDWKNTRVDFWKDNPPQFMPDLRDRLLSNDKFIETWDKLYTDGSARFTGRAISYYLKNNQ